jgi:HD-GYP domain-containing protein (c-di-GMP phosphodiesterase class II)
VLAPLAGADILHRVVADDPRPYLAGRVELREMCEALAIVVDLKGRYLLGHSRHVATLVAGAASGTDLPDEDCEALELAALLHDIGRVGVPSSVWDRPGPRTPAETERVRLHTYWTGRVLARCPALAPLADVAAAHHEHLDGSGYHRGMRSEVLDRPARLLAAADAFAELTEPRPGRHALEPDDAAAELRAESRAGRLDAEACAAVIGAAGAHAGTVAYPCGLTTREVDVLRLAARGLSNAAIAAELVLSTRTVGNHLAHVYDKIGRRTRAGAAVFAIEHGLLPR